jgi:Na+/H+ antiporter NhaB
MADLGDSSMADTAHKHKVTSWITVGVLVVASILLGLAMVLQSLPLAIVGGILTVVGIVMGITGKIMDDAA